MAQSLQRKIKRGKVAFFPYFGKIVWVRKLAGGGFAKTFAPQDNRGQVFGNTYSRQKVRKLAGEE